MNDTELFISRGFGQRIGFGERPVLLVIDLVQAFTDPQQPLGSDLSSQIECTNRLIDEARLRATPIIFSTVAYEESDFSDAGIWAKKQRGVGTLHVNSNGPRLDQRLHHSPGDCILAKKYASCFFGTDLISRLVNLRADTVVLTGCTTSGCVRATAVDACQYGFRPMVVREAVGDRSRAAHEQSLQDLDFKYADVVEMEEALLGINSTSHD